MNAQEELNQLCVNTIRALSLDAVQKAKIGHLGLPLGAATMGHVLWTQFLRHNPRNPNWANRDRFVLSAGHGSMLLYSLLYLTGYDVSLEDIKNFRQWGSKTPGHPEFGHTPGVETTTGPLGQGVANAVGMALAAKHKATCYNRPGFELVNHHVYALVSDGDLMEGISHEAASLAGHLQLDNLIFLYDDNHVTIDGSTDLTFSDDIQQRFESFGWHTACVEDGNCSDKIAQAIEDARQQNKPSLIAVRTVIGYGSPHRQGTASAHGGPYGEEEVALTKAALGWPSQEPFTVPEAVLAHYRTALEKGAQAEAAWNTCLEAYRQAHPQLAKRWAADFQKTVALDWEAVLPDFSREDSPLATRKASGKVLNAIAPHLPSLIGGSADLAGSNNTTIQGQAALCAADFSGRNIHFGVREHAMGAILNGMALYGGLIPYGGTFLVFSDYMRPAIRLAALMGLHVVYVFTHDSVGVGEDGPTHQPVEHLAALRAVPNLTVIRPADGAETAAAWKIALEQHQGPVALCLSRQAVPHLKRAGASALEGVARGGYVLSDPEGGTFDLILIATGSEVQLAYQAQQQLAESGVGARVVSLPSWELFEAQPQSYRDAVLPPESPLRIAIEAGSPLGWERYVGPLGQVIGLTRYGASAPGGQIMEKLGFTTDNVVKQAQHLLSTSQGA